MTIIRFPPRRSAAIWLTPSREDPGGWLVLHRGHGWIHGSSAAAAADAVWLSANAGGLPIRESIQASPGILK
jgi:hypothetical protein